LQISHPEGVEVPPKATMVPEGITEEERSMPSIAVFKVAKFVLISAERINVPEVKLLKVPVTATAKRLGIPKPIEIPIPILIPFQISFFILFSFCILDPFFSSHSQKSIL
jgi:hypothetical protein